MKVRVDRERCVGHAVCAELCPEVFRIDTENRAVVVMSVVPTNLEQDVNGAADACPEGCIVIEPERT